MVILVLHCGYSFCFGKNINNLFEFTSYFYFPHVNVNHNQKATSC